MEFIMELIGRYLLTGILVMGATAIFLIIRMLYMANRSGKPMEFVEYFKEYTKELDEEIDKSTIPEAAWHDFLVLVKWPYTMPRAGKKYFSMEARVLEKLGC